MELSLQEKQAAAAFRSFVKIASDDPFMHVFQEYGEKFASIAHASFVDNLVKIAADTGDFWPVESVIEHLTPEHEELLKQAGLTDILRAAKSGIQGAGRSISSAVGNMGAGGAAKRMQAAGKEHEALKAIMAPSQFRATPAAMAPMALKEGPQLAKRVAYNPAQVQKGLVGQELAKDRAAIMASAPSAVPAGQPRYNPLDIAHARAVSTPQVAPPPAARQTAPRAEPVQLPTHGVMGQLKEMNPFAGMANTFRGAMQPAPFAAAY